MCTMKLNWCSNHLNRVAPKPLYNPAIPLLLSSSREMAMAVGRAKLASAAPLLAPPWLAMSFL